MPDHAKTIQPLSGQPESQVAATQKLVAGVVFGLMFGFLLQKGGVGKFNVLVGQLLLQDFTVAKVMLTAILVGMAGVFTLNYFGRVNLHIKPTRIRANAIGGLLFGAGFALLGYCPGTATVALGQGNWDVLFGMAGLIAGSWVFAEFSGWSKRTIEERGDLGEVLLPDLLRVPRGLFVVILAVVLIVGLFVLERTFPR